MRLGSSRQYATNPDEGMGPFEYNDEEFEQTLSEHEYVNEPYGSTDGDDDYRAERKRPLMRKTILVSVFVMLLILIGALAISTAKAKKNNGGSQVSSSEAAVSTSSNLDSSGSGDDDDDDDDDEETDGNKGSDSSASLSRDYTPAPTPTPKPSTPAPIPAPPAVCKNEITVDETCYNIGDKITVNFISCNPGKLEWIGLYKASADADGKLYPNYKYWEWTCGGRGDPSEDLLKEGSISFTIAVEPGEYKVFLISGDNYPYNYLASSEAFRVSRECYGDGGMPAGHTYSDKPVASPVPTRRPTPSPNAAPTTKAPTRLPTNAPTKAPSPTRSTKAPTKVPTRSPTIAPTKAPTAAPTNAPTKASTKAPSRGRTK